MVVEVLRLQIIVPERLLKNRTKKEKTNRDWLAPSLSPSVPAIA